MVIVMFIIYLPVAMVKIFNFILQCKSSNNGKILS